MSHRPEKREQRDREGEWKIKENKRKNTFDQLPDNVSKRLQGHWHQDKPDITRHSTDREKQHRVFRNAQA